jgi:histone demethylase JARID1
MQDSGQPNIKVPENIFTMVCEKCKGGHYEEKIILCDRCDKGWHMFCLSPAMENVPDGDWVCPSCIARGRLGFKSLNSPGALQLDNS